MPKRALLWTVVAIFITTGAEAACKVCFPNCQNAAAGVQGRPNCVDSGSSCTITGTVCTGGSGGGGCECGTAGCDPCNPTRCEPVPDEWQLVRVDVQERQQTQQWRLVIVTAVN
jgi:hypothetical protein